MFKGYNKDCGIQKYLKHASSWFLKNNNHETVCLACEDGLTGETR